MVKKSFFLALVKLHSPTLEKLSLHNLWYQGEMPVSSEMLDQSALQFWQKKSWDQV